MAVFLTGNFFFPWQIAEEIRHILDAYDKAIPAVLEIPSKEHPYDPTKDSILRRAKVRSCTVEITSVDLHRHNEYSYLFGLMMYDDGIYASGLMTTTSKVVETSVTNNSLSKDFPHLDDHTKQITDTPGFKPFTI